MNRGVRLEGGLSDMKTEQLYPHMLRAQQDAIEDFTFDKTNKDPQPPASYVCSTATNPCLQTFQNKYQT